MSGAAGREACCDVVNRGVAVWKGRVFAGTLDGRLIALDAATGKLDWRFYVAPAGPDPPFEQPELERAAQTWSRDSHRALVTPGP